MSVYVTIWFLLDSAALNESFSGLKTFLINRRNASHTTHRDLSWLGVDFGTVATTGIAGLVMFSPLNPTSLIVIGPCALLALSRNTTVHIHWVAEQGSKPVNLKIFWHMSQKRTSHWTKLVQSFHPISSPAIHLCFCIISICWSLLG